LLYATTPSNRYATAILAHIEPATRKIHYVNAGHNDGTLIRSNGEVESLKSTGPPLGLIPRIPFQGAEVQMRTGDLLALYSDGIVEAQNPDEIEFGDERFIAALKELAARPAAEIVAEMFERVDRFVDGAPQHDDITLMLIKAE
jgi:phosphoserine phosphatase RsbU/P